MDLTTLKDSELHDPSAGIAAEWERRRASTVTEQAITDVITIKRNHDAGTDDFSGQVYVVPLP